jgi:4-aminobutyrate aminotransferase/(S)-3-amino-2-methylpropionate transaminase
VCTPAAVIIEPIQGEGGTIVPPPAFLPKVREICDRHDVLLICDEIQTGFCRTGDWFASSYEGIEPDLVTTAKGIAGGLPLAGVTGRADLMDAVHVGGLGGTYGGNPIACAAALATIETMRELNLAAEALRIGETMKPVLRDLADHYPAIGDIRGRGAMIAVEVVDPGGIGANGPAPDAATAAAVSKACHAAGLLTLTCGTYGNVLRFLPPLVMPDDTLRRGLDIVAESFASVCG